MKVERKIQQKAKNTALNSRELIWSALSEADQKPKASLFSEDIEPHPDSEASQKKMLLASNGEREREGNESPTFDHHNKSLHALEEGET